MLITSELRLYDDMLAVVSLSGKHVEAAFYADITKASLTGPALTLETKAAAVYDAPDDETSQAVTLSAGTISFTVAYESNPERCGEESRKNESEVSSNEERKSSGSRSLRS